MNTSYISHTEEMAQELVHLRGVRNCEDLTQKENDLILSRAIQDEIIDPDDLYSCDYNVNPNDLVTDLLEGRITKEQLADQLVGRLRYALTPHIDYTLDNEYENQYEMGIENPGISEVWIQDYQQRYRDMKEAV